MKNMKQILKKRIVTRTLKMAVIGPSMCVIMGSVS